MATAFKNNLQEIQKFEVYYTKYSKKAGLENI